MDLSGRQKEAKNPVASKLFQLMAEKQSNLFLSADVSSSKELLYLASLLGNEIIGLKTHIDIINDFSWDFIKSLREIAEKKGFILFEDRKFADIGHTVKAQYGEGTFRIADWADLINAHMLPGPGIIEGLKQIGLPKQRALLLLAQMSSKESLITDEYTKKCIEYAEKYPEFVIGFICQKKLVNSPGLLHFTPGVSLDRTGDLLGQNYRTVTEVVQRSQSDIIIVGRSIIRAKDPLLEARNYRLAGWKAYENR